MPCGVTLDIVPSSSAIRIFASISRGKNTIACAHPSPRMGRGVRGEGRLPSPVIGRGAGGEGMARVIYSPQRGAILRYEFDWDPEKERANIRKHGISFRQAASVFRDPDQLSMFDEGHSEKRRPLDNSWY
ncbi:MAG: BrnT family toxin [Chloroflexota bacterium]